MTTTTLFTDEAVGATPGEVEAVKHTAAEASSAYCLNIRVTLPATGLPDFRSQFYLRHASTTFDELAANGPAKLRHCARTLPLEFPDPVPGKEYIFATEFEQLVGEYVHAWIELGGVPTAYTVDLNITEY